MYNSSYTTTNGGLGRDSVERDMLFKLSNLNSNLALTLGYLNPAFNNSALDLKSEAPRSSPTPKLVKSQLVRLLTVRKLRVVPHFSSGIVEQAKGKRTWKSHLFTRGVIFTRALYYPWSWGEMRLLVVKPVGILNHIMFHLSYLFHYPRKAPTEEWIIKYLFLSFIYLFIFRPNWTTG